MTVVVSRIHFKSQLLARNESVTVGTADKERWEEETLVTLVTVTVTRWRTKTLKSVSLLKRKLARQLAKVELVVGQMAESSKQVGSVVTVVIIFIV